MTRRAVRRIVRRARRRAIRALCRRGATSLRHTRRRSWRRSAYQWGTVAKGLPVRYRGLYRIPLNPARDDVWESEPGALTPLRFCRPLRILTIACTSVGGASRIGVTPAWPT